MCALDLDSHRRTLDLGVRALAQVTQNRTSADPLAYEVWYEHVVGHRPALSAQIKALVAGGSLSDDSLRDLHARHLSPLRTSQRIEEIGAGAQTEVRNLLDSVKTTISDLSGVGDDLQATADRLAEQGLAIDAMRGLVDTAVVKTRKASDANAVLHTRLIESEISIAALHIALEEARDEALRDSLTGLYNRRAFDAQLKDRFEAASASDAPLCLIMLDIDHFKSFNDSHGHPVGDQVIRLVGTYLKERITPPDLPARYGGEEFAIVAVGHSLPEAMSMAEDIRRKFERDGMGSLGTKDVRASLTVSAGVASRRPGDTVASLLARADDCLYSAKRLGRNRVSTDVATYPEQAEIDEHRESEAAGASGVKGVVAAGLRLVSGWGQALHRRLRPNPA